MTEQEYINATNRVKVSAALTILRDVLVTDGSGIDEREFAFIKLKLRNIEEDLFAIVDIKEAT